jgi:hypothetical protein
MPTRDEVKATIDQLPEALLVHAGAMLENLLNPPPRHPEMERMRQRARNYRSLVEQRFRETRKPGTIGGMSGGGSAGMHEGTPFGRQGFHYWDEKALVHQSLQSFDGQEIEVMERLSFSADRTMLICALEISSGRHTVKYQEEFPAFPAAGEEPTF